MKIVTVLRTSETYNRKYVEMLHSQCQQFAPGIEFVCISDDPLVPGYSKMQHDWPRWWPKIEMFKISGPVLYLDLDTTLVKDIRNVIDAAKNRSFVGVRDFYKDKRMERTLQSCVMYWSGDMSYLYDEFIKDPQRHMAECVSSRWWGDQGFIEKYNKEQTVYWQDIIPNSVVSWKVHCRGGIPASASIVAFHGKPKPWEVKLK